MERQSLPTLLIATDTWELVYDYNRILLPRGIRTAPHPLNHRLLTRVREHQPVAILLDFSVAERDHGLFLLDALRHDPRTAACPVIVILDDPVAYAAITSRAYRACPRASETGQRGTPALARRRIRPHAPAAAPPARRSCPAHARGRLSEVTSSK